MFKALLSMGRAASSGFSWDPASLGGKLALKALTSSARRPKESR
jgi:hypothetical protein